jgi:hypothetical protein
MPHSEEKDSSHIFGFAFLLQIGEESSLNEQFGEIQLDRPILEIILILLIELK